MIEAWIREPGGRRSKALSELGAFIKKADSDMIEEAKWTPTNPLQGARLVSRRDSSYSKPSS